MDLDLIQPKSNQTNRSFPQLPEEADVENETFRPTISNPIAFLFSANRHDSLIITRFSI